MCPYPPNGMEWNGMEWNGMEWNGVSISCHTTVDSMISQAESFLSDVDSFLSDLGFEFSSDDPVEYCWNPPGDDVCCCHYYHSWCWLGFWYGCCYGYHKHPRWMIIIVIISAILLHVYWDDIPEKIRFYTLFVFMRKTQVL